MDESETKGIKIEIEQKKKIDKLRIFFIIGIYAAICLLIFVMITLLRNVDEIKSDPIVYGITTKGFLACRCQDDLDRTFYYGTNGSLRIVDYYSIVKEVDPTRKCPTLDRFNITDMNLTLD